jgi:hypothetical protein
MTPKELTKDDVLTFVKSQDGAFNYQMMMQGIGIISVQAKTNLYKIISRLREEGVIVNIATGTFRKANNEKKLIDWEAADLNNNLHLNLPFNLHTLCKVYPKSIIVVTAGKNGGKTAFAMESVCLNYPLIPTDLFNSETGPEQLKARFESLQIPHPAPFPVYECYNNFADQIDPTHLSIIDYMDFNNEVYKVGEEIDNVYRKLTTGAAIIFIQRPPPQVSVYRGKKQITERDLAYGGGFSAKRAILYVSMGMISKLEGHLKIIYCKTPMNPKVNPNNMMFSYKFNENGFFTDIHPYYEVAEDDTNV